MSFNFSKGTPEAGRQSFQHPERWHPAWGEAPLRMARAAGGRRVFPGVAARRSHWGREWDCARTKGENETEDTGEKTLHRARVGQVRGWQVCPGSQPGGDNEQVPSSTQQSENRMARGITLRVRAGENCPRGLSQWKRYSPHPAPGNAIWRC